MEHPIKKSYANLCSSCKYYVREELTNLSSGICELRNTKTFATGGCKEYINIHEPELNETEEIAEDLCDVSDVEETAITEEPYQEQQPLHTNLCGSCRYFEKSGGFKRSVGQCSNQRRTVQKTDGCEKYRQKVSSYK